jgi:hypothetical protein
VTEAEPPLVFRGAAWKSGLRTLGAIVGAVLCFLLWESDYESRRYSKELVEIAAIIGLVMCCMLAIFSFVRLCWPAELVLTSEGFCVRGFRKAVLIPWDDVERFELIEFRGSTMAGYILKPAAKSGGRDRVAHRILMPGMDGTIAVSPEESPGWVVKTLSDWRRRYSRDA